jgi:hypothetical protein
MIKMQWIPISDRPPLNEQSYRQFIRVEGSCTHHDTTWHREWYGIARTRPLDAPDRLYQYCRYDIEQICKDGDIDLWTVVVTHWMPIEFPSIDDVIDDDDDDDNWCIVESTSHLIGGNVWESFFVKQVYGPFNTYDKAYDYRLENFGELFSEDHGDTKTMREIVKFNNVPKKKG